MKINLLSHYDMDGCVCEILLRKILDEKFGKAKLTGYAQLNEHLERLLEESEMLMITDIAMDETRWEMVINSKIPILIIDHHETSIESLKSYTLPSNIKVILSTAFCVAGLVMKHFKDTYEFSDELKLLTKYTNDYDMWIHKHKESKVLNAFFWDYKAISFNASFRHGMNIEKYKLYLPLYDQKCIEISKYLDGCEQIEINDTPKAIILMAYKHIGEVTEHFKDFDVYFIVQNNKKIAIRFKTDYNMSETFKRTKIKFGDIIESLGCHPLAGGINLKTGSDEMILEIIEFIYGEIAYD